MFRNPFQIKLSGACGLVSALTCALVTVTTTVLHMSRLQALRECEYAQKTRTCTCYSDLIESQVDRVDKGELAAPDPSLLQANSSSLPLFQKACAWCSTPFRTAAWSTDPCTPA